MAGGQEAKVIPALAAVLLTAATLAVSRRPRTQEQAKADAPKGEWALGAGMGIGVLSLFALVFWAKESGVSTLELWLLGGLVAFGWICGIARRYVYGRWN
jgi:hypothetical protein